MKTFVYLAVYGGEISCRRYLLAHKRNNPYFFQRKIVKTRNIYTDKRYNCWVFPGGKMEGVNKCPFKEAIREFYEETGREIKENYTYKSCFQDGGCKVYVFFVRYSDIGGLEMGIQTDLAKSDYDRLAHTQIQDDELDKVQIYTNQEAKEKFKETPSATDWFIRALNEFEDSEEQQNRFSEYDEGREDDVSESKKPRKPKYVY